MKTLNDLLTRGYKFEPSSYFTNGWKMLTKNFGPFLGMTLLFLLIGGVLGSIPYVSLFANFINVLLFAGFYIYLFNYQSKKHDAKDFFGGFKYALDIIAQQLVTLLFMLPLILVAFSMGFPFEELIQYMMQSISIEEFSTAMEQSVEGNVGGFLFCMFILFVLSMYLLVSYMFAIPLIVTGNLKFWEAMETSRKVVAKQFIGFLFATILLLIIVLLMVVVTCGLGLLVAVPMIYCIFYAAYDAIFQPTDSQSKSTLEEFGSLKGDYNSESDFH